MLSGLCNSSVTSVSVNILGGNSGEPKVEHNVGDVAHAHTGGFPINSVICRQRSQGPVKSKSTDERHHKSSQFNLSTRMLYPIFLDTTMLTRVINICCLIIPILYHHVDTLIGCTIVHCINAGTKVTVVFDVCYM